MNRKDRLAQRKYIRERHRPSAAEEAARKKSLRDAIHMVSGGPVRRSATDDADDIEDDGSSDRGTKLLPYTCAKCGDAVTGLAKGMKALEKLTPQIASYRHGAYPYALAFACAGCSKRLDVGGFVKASRVRPALRKRLWSHVHATVGVGIDDSHAWASAFLPLGTGKDNHVRDHAEYLRYVSEADFDHATDDLDEVVRVLDHLKKQDERFAARLLATVLGVGSQRVDDLIETKAWLAFLRKRPRAVAAFKATADRRKLSQDGYASFLAILDQ